MAEFIKGEYIKSLRRKNRGNELAGPLDNHFGAHQRVVTSNNEPVLVLRDIRTGSSVEVPREKVWETNVKS